MLACSNKSAAHSKWIRAEETISPLGVKGVGEGGVIGGMVAIGNAVSHALKEFGIEITEMPLTPPVVRKLIRKATKQP